MVFPQDTNEKVLKRAKADYQKIQKYLLRLTYKEDYHQSPEWKQFKLLTFEEFLIAVGMVEARVIHILKEPENAT